MFCLFENGRSTQVLLFSKSMEKLNKKKTKNKKQPKTTKKQTKQQQQKHLETREVMQRNISGNFEVFLNDIENI